MKPQAEHIEAVIAEALAKYEAGRKAYGQLDLDTDSRDFLLEAEAELLDCINYCVFQIIKLRGIKDANPAKFTRKAGRCSICSCNTDTGLCEICIQRYPSLTDKIIRHWNGDPCAACEDDRRCYAFCNECHAASRSLQRP